MQYDEIKEINETINKIKVEVATNNLLTKQAVDASKELSNTMTSVRETMLIMSENMKQGNRELSDNMICLKENIINLEEKVENRFENVNRKISSIDEEGKFNIRVWISENFVSLLTSIAFLGYVIYNSIK